MKSIPQVVFICFWLLSCICPVLVSAQTGKEKNMPLLFEKAYLHTDRDVYAIGDTLWYKAYLVNGQDNKPTASSGNLYVELLSPDSARILNREIIRMEGGTGKGDMSLDDSLPAGQYRLRAYTNWMRNFGDNFVFEKNITILNTRALPEASNSEKSSSSSKQDQKEKSATATSTNLLPLVRFYPEGGSLVNGISAFVGVKAEDGYGKGIPATGAVISAAGDTVSRFTCDSLGIGELTILPLAGKSYHAAVDLGTRHDVFQLPSALSTGLALQIRQTDTAIHAVVHAAGLPDTTISLTVKHSGKTILTQRFNLKQAQVAFKINTKDLPEGISAITIYNTDNKPECERLVYIHHAQQDKNNKLTIATDKKSYQPKEQTTITIQSQPNSSLSMAVVDASVVPNQTTDIVSYLNLQSELRGNIESSNRYFDTTNVNRIKQLDELLLTQGWRDFVWRRMADTSIRISYASENGINMSGRIRDENLNKLLPNLNITLYADQAKGTKTFTARSDSAGRFHFDGLMLYGKHNVTLSAVNDKGQSKGAFWVDTLLPMPVNKRSLAKPVDREDALQAIQKKQAVVKLSKINGVTRLKEVNISDKKNKSIVLSDGSVYTPWGTDQTLIITPKDYEFKTLTWYLLQKMKDAKASQSADIPGVGFMVDGHMKYPIIFINGVELFNVDRNLYFNMPIDKFKTIEIKEVAEQTYKLPLEYLLYLTLKDGYLTDNPGSLTTSIEGYYQAQTFYEPLTNAKPSIADYRNTIHWQPDIKTDATGKATISFYNTLPQTSVRVIVQGISQQGIPLAATSTYEVK